MLNFFHSLRGRLEGWARELKRQLLALYYAARHPGLSRFTKILILFTLGYALSPIDLIPDFIPVLGFLDDLILLPLLIALCVRMIPDDIRKEALKKAEDERKVLRKNKFAGFVIILIWVFIAGRILWGLIFRISRS